MAYYYGVPSYYSFFSGIFSFFGASVGFILTILVIVGRWKMYEKANEPGWASLIPIYSEYVLFKIGWGSGWLLLLMLIPVVNLIVAIMLCLKIARAYGMGGGFAIGLVFLPSIFYPILGFSDAVYCGPQ